MTRLHEVIQLATRNENGQYIPKPLTIKSHSRAEISDIQTNFEIHTTSWSLMNLLRGEDK